MTTATVREGHNQVQSLDPHRGDTQQDQRDAQEEVHWPNLGEQESLPLWSDQDNTCKPCGQVIIVSHWSILLKSLFSLVRRPRTGRCDNCSQERDVVSLSQLTKKYMFLFAMGDSIVTLEEEEGDCENNPVPSR